MTHMTHKGQSGFPKKYECYQMYELSCWRSRKMWHLFWRNPKMHKNDAWTVMYMAIVVTVYSISFKLEFFNICFVTPVVMKRLPKKLLISFSCLSSISLYFITRMHLGIIKIMGKRDGVELSTPYLHRLSMQGIGGSIPRSANPREVR